MTFRMVQTILTLGCLGAGSLLGTGCGDGSDVLDQRDDTIVDGELAFEDDAVAAVLTIQDNGQVGLCTATLVGPRALLFAAHCVTDDGQTSNAVRAIAYFGQDLIRHFDPNDEDPRFIAQVEISQLRVHENWNGDFFLGNDFAVAILAEDVPVRPVSVSFAPLEFTIDDEVRIVGFGNDTVELVDGEIQLSGSGIKREAVAVVSDLDPNFIVIDGTGNNAEPCPGDSGGPTYFPNRDRVIGVTSFGLSPIDQPELRCNYIGVQVRVDSAISFIARARIPALPASALDGLVIDLPR